MPKDLFSTDTKYTIDTCSLMEMFREGRNYPRNTFKSLFNDFCKLVSKNVVISHIEVFREIENGGKSDELYKWAIGNKFMFKDYDFTEETPIINHMSNKFAEWVSNKISPINADPWLIAQAKSYKITLISEETPTTRNTQIKNIRIPDVCKDYSVKSINFLDFIVEQGFTY